MARTILLRDERGEYPVTILDDDRVKVRDGEAIETRTFSDGRVHIEGPHPRAAWAVADGDARWVFVDGQVHRFEIAKTGTRRRTARHQGTLEAPMPATVVRIQAVVGSPVKRGDTLIILEAMKMELPVRAPADGVVTAINCRERELVQPGVPLIEISDQ